MGVIKQLHDATPFQSDARHTQPRTARRLIAPRGMVSVRLVLPGSGAGDCRAPLPATLASLRAAAERHFGAELRGKVGSWRAGARRQGRWVLPPLPRFRRRSKAAPPAAAACLLHSPCPAMQHALPNPSPAAPLDQDYALTDTAKAFESDADAEGLRDGAMLVLALGADRALAAPAREKISFQPHPKTLTMAGEFEYFAAQVRRRAVEAGGARNRCRPVLLLKCNTCRAPPMLLPLHCGSLPLPLFRLRQGRHPFVYALAEFVDNSLRATRRNGSRPRSITISLVRCGPAAAGQDAAVRQSGG